MAKSIAILTKVFWFLGISALVAAGQAAYLTAERIGEHPRWFWALFVLGSVGLLGVSSLAAAWGMTFGKKWARGVGIAASLLAVVLMPPAGIFGLVVLLRGKSAAALKEFAEHRRAERERGHSKGMWVSGAVAVVSLVVIVEWLRWAMKVHHVPPAPWWQLIGILVGTNGLLVLVHELGHAMAGWAVGFELQYLSVGRLAGRKENGRWRLEWGGVIGWSGGFAGAIPAKHGEMRKRLMIYTAGGPLASLAVSVAALGGFWVVVDTPHASMATLLGALAAFSFPMFAASLVPVRSKGFLSDGAGLLELWRMTAAGQREIAICECIVSGVRPEAIGGWDPRWVEAATAVGDGSLRHAAGCLLAYLYWLERNEVEKAGRWLDEALAVRMQSKVGLRASLTGYSYEAAYFAGRYRQDREGARRWLEMFGKKAERTPMYCLARAAVAGVEGDFEECEVWIAQGRERLAQHRRPSGFSQFEEARLEELDVFLTSSRRVPQELDSFLESQGQESPQDQEDPAPEVGCS